MAEAATTPPPVVISLKEEAVSATPPERIELQIATASTQPCDTPPSDEIVVCAPDSAAFRFGRITPVPEQALPKAEMKLSGSATIATQLQAGSVGSAPTNRAMVTVKVAF